MRRRLPILLLSSLLIPAASTAAPNEDAEVQRQADPQRQEVAHQEVAQPLDLGPPMTLHEPKRGTLLFRTTHPGAFLPAPALDTEVTIGVTGIVARARVRQRFHNPTADWLEGVYVFPLPENAAVDHLEMIVGDRVVVGEIREREEAKRVYEEAKREGKKASLVSQERPNVFTTAVANIGPDEDVEVVIEYQEDLRYDQGRFHLRFPLVVAPRYIPGSVRAEGVAGTGWAGNTSRVPDAERLTPPLAPPGSGVSNPVTIEVRLDAGLPLGRLGSPSHSVAVAQDGAGRYRVALAGLVVADRDFVLEWEPRPGTEPQAALFTQELDDELYHLLMVVPPHGTEAAAARLPRETIFVIDTSGSMGGTSIVQAREALLLALGRLQPGDFFNVVRFSDAARRLFPESRPADPDELDEARRFIRGLEAGGGTEMMHALELALGDADGGRGVRQVIFATDGSVGNEVELLRYIRNHLGVSRLFTIGIGSAPNSYFMREAARFGRGTFTFIGNVHEVTEKMDALFAKLESPVLHDVEVTWADAAVESWPEAVGDLYLGEPVLVVARAHGGGAGVKVAGWRGADYWEQDVRLGGGLAAGGLDKLWARKKIAALMDRQVAGVPESQVREQVLAVALAHQLVSKYTSLVAVDVTPTAPAGVTPQTRPLPVMLPDGWSYEHVFGARLPRTATPAPSRLLLGTILLFVALRLWRLARETR